MPATHYAGLCPHHVAGVVYGGVPVIIRIARQPAALVRVDLTIPPVRLGPHHFLFVVDRRLHCISRVRQLLHLARKVPVDVAVLLPHQVAPVVHRGVYMFVRIARQLAPRARHDLVVRHSRRSVLKKLRPDHLAKVVHASSHVLQVRTRRHRLGAVPASAAHRHIHLQDGPGCSICRHHKIVGRARAHWHGKRGLRAICVVVAVKGRQRPAISGICRQDRIVVASRGVDGQRAVLRCRVFIPDRSVPAAISASHHWIIACSRRCCRVHGISVGCPGDLPGTRAGIRNAADNGDVVQVPAFESIDTAINSVEGKFEFDGLAGVCGKDGHKIVPLVFHAGERRQVRPGAAVVRGNGNGPFVISCVLFRFFPAPEGQRLARGNDVRTDYERPLVCRSRRIIRPGRILSIPP